MRSATRLSVSWDRSHAHRHLSLVVDAPRAADSGAQRHGGNDVRAPAPRLLLDGDHGPDLAAGGPARPAVGHGLGPDVDGRVFLPQWGKDFFRSTCIPVFV